MAKRKARCKMCAGRPAPGREDPIDHALKDPSTCRIGPVTTTGDAGRSCTVVGAVRQFRSCKYARLHPLLGGFGKINDGSSRDVP